MEVVLSFTLRSVTVAELVAVTEPIAELVTDPIAELVEAVKAAEAVEAIAALHAQIKRRAPVAFGCGFRSLSVPLRSTSHAPCQTLPAGRVRSTATRQALLLSVQPQRSGRERGNALIAQGRGARNFIQEKEIEIRELRQFQAAISEGKAPRPCRAYPLRAPRLRSANSSKAKFINSRALQAGLSKPAFEALRKSGTRRSPKLSGIQPLSCRGQLKFSHNALISESIGAFPQRR